MEFQLKNNESYIKFFLVNFFDDTKDYEFCVDVKCGSMSVLNKSVYANKKELDLFYNGLKQIYSDLHGELKTNFEYDTDIIVKIECTRSGHLRIVCDVHDGPTFGNKLHIEFETDQTYIKETLDEIKEILSK